MDGARRRERAGKRAEARAVLESEASSANATAERAESEAAAAAKDAEALKSSNGLLKAELEQIIVERDEMRARVSEAEMKSAADAMAKVKVILQKVRLADHQFVAVIVLPAPSQSALLRIGPLTVVLLLRK